MNLPLKILMLEDSPEDAEIIQRVLGKEKLAYQCRLAMNKQEFEHALEDFSPDVILSDNSLPQFNAKEALHMTRSKHQHTPFILVTGTVSEEYAANIIKEGADDYILKDRMARLPAAIDAALKKRRATKEIADYRYALDQATIVAITDEKGIIQYANDNFCKISKYQPAELAGQNYRIVNSGYHPSSFMRQVWNNISEGQSWRGEFCNMARNGELYWVDTTIIPFLDGNKKPYQYLAISIDVTERKKLEAALLEQQRREQLRMTATALEAQEKERNSLGQELHDNVNQILVGTKLFLSMIKTDPQKNYELINSSMANIQAAIEENRRLAHVLTAPDFEAKNLVDQVSFLIRNMLSATGIDVHFHYAHFREALLTGEQKLAVYRILQEQCTNIVKHAQAHLVDVSLATKDAFLTMRIADDGKGTEAGEATAGVGLKNIKGRLSVFNGTASIATSPGNGFVLQVKMPLKEQ